MLFIRLILFLNWKPRLLILLFYTYIKITRNTTYTVHWISLVNFTSITLSIFNFSRFELFVTEFGNYKVFLNISIITEVIIIDKRTMLVNKIEKLV